MAWGFLDAYCDEGFAVLTPRWIGTAGTSPSGLNRAQLLADAAALTQNPTPNAPPGPAPSLWQRLGAWLEALFGRPRVPR